MLPILDTHQHLWDLEKFDLLWLKDGGPLGRNHVMSDYLEATGGLNIVKTVYMEVDVEPSQHPAEARYVIDLCERDDNPMAAAVIGGRPASEDFAAYLAPFEGSPFIKGVRQVLHGGTPAGYCLQKEFLRGVRRLGELDMSFDICIRSEELPDAASLAHACPGTRFILDHCGNANVQASDRAQWERDIATVAARSNVVCKVSGIVGSAKPSTWTADDLAPIINHVAEVFGHDRIMFGSDWPVCTSTASARQWVDALQSIVAGWSEEDRRKLFFDNAARFYWIG